MLYGQPSFFTQQHYESHRGLAPSDLCELVVHCLELVAALGSSGLGFRFKGGNSLLLLLEDPQRFSIDVDIVTGHSREELTQWVAAEVERSEVFVRWESRSPRTKPWLPLISFKLFFNSAYRASGDAYVMLDAVLEPAPYPGIRRPVRCGSMYEAPVEVEVPSVAGLMGDKLLTLGPATLGIPLGKGKEAQRLKHVFDIALLSNQPWSLSDVHSSVLACQHQEQQMQGRSFSWEDIMADTRTFCRATLPHSEPPPLGALTPGSYLEEIVKGFPEFRQHLFRQNYTWADLQMDFRRVDALVTGLNAH